MTATDFAAASIKEKKKVKKQGEITINSKIVYPSQLSFKSEEDSDQTALLTVGLHVPLKWCNMK